MMKISLQTVNQGGKRVTMGRTNEQLRLTKEKIESQYLSLTEGYQHPRIALKKVINTHSLP